MIESLSVGPLGERCYVLPYADSRACILVDPGDEGQRIVSFLSGKGLVPTCVVLTHGHLDHSAAIPDIIAAFGTDGARTEPIPVAIHAEDAGYLGAEAEEKNRATFVAIRAMGFFRHFWRSLPAASILLSDGDLLPPGPDGEPADWRVIHSPGHTRGSICLHDPVHGLLVSGDTLFNSGVGRTDGPDSDPAALMASLERLCALPPETRVFPGHGSATTIGAEKEGLGF